MIRALLFDMDGVVVDSNRVHREAWIEFNARHGLATTEAMLGRMYGRRNDEIVRDFFGRSLTAEEVVEKGARKEALFRELIAPHLEALSVPGIRAFLERHRNLAIALATNAEAANAEFVLERLSLGSLFRFVVNGQQVTHAKPHPEIYLRAAESVGAAPGECLVFEDSHAGVAAGVAAGMTVIGIRTTHPELPGTALTVDNFLDPAIDLWLRAH